MSRLKWWGPALLALLAVVYWLQGTENNAGVIDYKTVAVEVGDITRSVSATGAISPLITVEVGSQLSGQVLSLSADFNTEVTEGQVIATIDPQTFRARVQQAAAELEVAKANLTVQKAGLVARRAALLEARRSYKRKKELTEKDYISVAELDTAQSRLDTAAADVAIAKAQIVNARATIEQRRASLQQTRIDLERTEIRAPVDGIVIERNVDVGQTVAASFSSPVLFRIAQDLRRMQVEASVDEADIGNVKDDNPVSFTVDAFEGRTYRGIVRQVRKSPETIENVVTYAVIIDAPNDDLSLLPGMTANVQIVTGRRRNVLRVDNAALRFTPPRGAVNTTASFGGGNGGNGFLQRLTDTLALGADQQKQLRQAFGRLRRQAGQSRQNGGQGGGGAGAGGFRQQMTKMLSRILTAGQMAKYRALQSARGTVRFGRLWTRSDAGEFVGKRVRLGISDDKFTEISSPTVKEGDRVVSRASRANTRS